MIKISPLNRRKKLKPALNPRSPSFYSPLRRIASQASSSPKDLILQVIPPAKIFNQILDIKPFSLIDTSAAIDGKLDQIFKLHKQRIASDHSSKIIKIKSQSTPSRNLKKKCIEIINKDHSRKTSKAKSTYPSLFKEKSRRPSDSYDSVQSQLAQQLISESKKQKRAFADTMNRLHKLIQHAQLEYARKNDIDISQKDLKRFGLRKIACKDRVCTQYCDDYQQTLQTSNLQVNKHDVNSWMRSSRKLVNIATLDEQNKQEKTIPKITPLIKNSNDFLYKRYFKNNNERKIILAASLEAE